jgi:hypothetical protein
MCLYAIRAAKAAKKKLKRAIHRILFFCMNVVDELNLLSHKSIGQIIRSAHFGAPFIMSYGFLTGSRPIFYALSWSIIISSFLFGITDGCIITLIEQKYLGDDFTIIDPILEIMGIPLNNWNKNVVSIHIAYLYILHILLLYRIRFMYSRNRVRWNL